MKVHRLLESLLKRSNSMPRAIKRLSRHARSPNRTDMQDAFRSRRIDAAKLYAAARNGCKSNMMVAYDANGRHCTLLNKAFFI